MFTSTALPVKSLSRTVFPAMVLSVKSLISPFEGEFFDTAETFPPLIDVDSFEQPAVSVLVDYSVITYARENTGIVR